MYVRHEGQTDNAYRNAVKLTAIAVDGSADLKE
jgi:hypothetical protein